MWKEGPPNNSNAFYLLNKDEELVLNLNDVPINFIYRNNNLEWLAFELDKKLIENFKNVYLHPKSLQQILIEDKRKKLRIDPDSYPFNHLFPKNAGKLCENELKLQKINNFEIRPTKNRSITDKALELLDKIKSELKKKIKSNIDNIYEQFKSQLLIIKEESMSLQQEENPLVQNCISFSSQNNHDNIIENVGSNFISVSNLISSNFPSDLCPNNEYTILPKNYENFQNKINDPENQIEQNINSLCIISPPDTFIQVDTDEICVLNPHQKRLRLSAADEREIRPFFPAIQSEIPKTVKKDSSEIQKEQAKIDEIFGINKILLTQKKSFYNKCIECRSTNNKIKTWYPCCDNYLCEACFTKNIYFLAELSDNENRKKNPDECYFCSNNLFFCTFCLLIDLKENLIRCSSLLCNSFFHSNCFECSQLLGNCTTEFSPETKIEFYKKFSTKFLKIYYNRKNLDEDDQKKLKTLNRQSLENFEKKNFLYNFYKNNTIEYIKFFLIYFTQELVENKKLMSIQYNPVFGKEKYCTKHICFQCFDFIDYSHDQEIKNKSECGISRHIESDCEFFSNPNVTIECKNYKSHFALLHLNFFREIYNLTKSACHKIIIVYDKKKINYDGILKKLKFRAKQLEEPNGKICQDRNHDSMILNMKQNHEEINQPNNSLCAYKKLNEKEYLKLQRELKEFLIYSNISKNSKDIPVWLLKQKYPKENLKCGCMELAVKHFEEVERKNRNFLITNFTKYLNNKNFKKFLELNKIQVCNAQCKNRANKIECNKFNCYASDSICSNRFKIKNESLDYFKIVKTLNKPNYGLVSLKAYLEGEFIMEAYGEIMTETAWMEVKDPQKIWYTFKFSSNGKCEIYLYFNRNGSLSKYINHSCTPNACLQIWNSETNVKHPFKKNRFSKETINQRFLIFALKNICAEEEITMDYRQHKIICANNENGVGNIQMFKCKCSPDCENIIGKNEYEFFLKKLKTVEEPIVSQMLLKNIFLNPFYFFKNKFTSYELYTVSHRKIFLLKNILKIKRKSVKIFHLKNPMYFKYFIQPNLVSFFGKIKCTICEEQISEPFICYQCFKFFHSSCFNNEKLYTENTCPLCKNSSKEKESHNSILPINEYHSSKIFSESIELMINLKIKESKLYTLNVYKVVSDYKKKICKFYSIFYEYHNEQGEKKYSILVKKFILRPAQNIKDNDECLRKYLDESKIIFTELVKMINNY